MAGRIAGLRDLMTWQNLREPLAFTGLSTGIGLMSGQSLPEALFEAVPGIAGAYGMQHVFEKGLPNAKFGIKWKGKQLNQKNGDPIQIHYGGIAGSVIGGGVGAELGSGAYNMIAPKRPGEEEVSVNPLLYAADEGVLPIWNVAKALR